ncbi:pentapeptide repeat-containing protein [candidate division TA06 bacterium]|nr:pentapeptide repeat-containing protein [candidate division TA06 bacterium]
MSISKEQIRQWRDRWTEEKVQEVKKAIKAGEPLPVDKLPLSEEDKKELPEPLRDRAPRETVDLRGISLQGFHLKGIDLRFAHLEGANLRMAHLEESNLRGAHLEEAELVDAHLERAKLEGVHLKGADLRGARLNEANLGHANLEEANLSYTHLKGANLRDTHLDGASLAGAHLEGANFSRAHLKNSYLENAHFNKTYLQDTRLEEAEDYRLVRWGKGHILGEELDGRLEIAQNLYRYLKGIYKGTREYNAFHYRENVLKTKRMAWRNPLRILRLLFLQWTYGYGTKPLRLLSYLIAISLLITVLLKLRQ